MLEILRTIASAGSALDSLYHDALNGNIILRDTKLEYDDASYGAALVFQCNGARVEFAPDGCVCLIDKNGKRELFDNHGYKWPMLGKAMGKLFADSE